MKHIRGKFTDLDGDHLHNDAGLIHLLDSISDLKHYSPSSYARLVKSVDLYLYYSELCHQNPKEIRDCYDKLVELKKTILNQLSAFYLKIQTFQEDKQLHKAIDSMRFLLNIHLAEIKVLNRTNPIDRNYKDVCSFPHEPHDFEMKHPTKNVLKYHQLF